MWLANAILKISWKYAEGSVPHALRRSPRTEKDREKKPVAFATPTRHGWCLLRCHPRNKASVPLGGGFQLINVFLGHAKVATIEQFWIDLGKIHLWLPSL